MSKRLHKQDGFKIFLLGIVSIIVLLTAIVVNITRNTSIQNSNAMQADTEVTRTGGSKVNNSKQKISNDQAENRAEKRAMIKAQQAAALRATAATATVKAANACTFPSTQSCTFNGQWGQKYCKENGQWNGSCDIGGYCNSPGNYSVCPCPPGVDENLGLGCNRYCVPLNSSVNGLSKTSYRSLGKWAASGCHVYENPGYKVVDYNLYCDDISNCSKFGVKSYCRDTRCVVPALDDSAP